MLGSVNLEFSEKIIVLDDVTKLIELNAIRFYLRKYDSNVQKMSAETSDMHGRELQDS